MESLKVAEKRNDIIWDYDSEADVLYISVGTPQKALGIDIGDGVISRIDPDTNEVIGLTIIGFSKRTLKFLKDQE